ncbi:putative uncharacterized protein [Rhodococcus sp. AW25M09]|uniref:hypothetical protein n=1 Tax=Rhodococcus sp. AW25M09 TaxID=1268303 RepID=UPI0002ACBBC6|nr:hypothetical protein [Rhodococcus sp. AW25M09]CCQ17728.1 putative uncharacterized protein [Rhodococcus sp. AW25M09]
MVDRGKSWCSVTRVVALTIAVVLSAASCTDSGDETSDQPRPSVSCAAAKDREHATGTWGRAAGESERTGFERLLTADCNIPSSEPSTFSSYDQLDGPRSLGLHLQTLCMPFEVAYVEDDDIVSVWVRTTVVQDLYAICDGDVDARLGTYVLVLDRDLGDRMVVPG